MIRFPTKDKFLVKIEQRIAAADLKGLKKIEDELLISTDAKVQNFAQHALCQIAERRQHLLDEVGAEVSDKEFIFPIIHELDPKSISSNFRSRMEAIRNHVLKTDTLDPLKILNRTQLFEIQRGGE